MRYIIVLINILKWIAPALGILAAVFCLLAVLFFIYKALKSLNLSDLLENQKKNISIRKHNRQAKQGIWSFPSELFFRKCNENCITEFESDYNIQKAANIVIELADMEGIKQENLKSYLIPAEFIRYYHQGKELATHKDAAAVHRSKQSSKASPLYSESVFLRRAANLASLSGPDKREQMLNYLLRDYLDKIEFKNEYDADPGIFETAMFLHPQEDHSYNASADDDAIIQNTSYLLSGLPDLPYDIKKLKQCTEYVKNQLELLKQKVVLSNPASDHILSNLHILDTDVKKSDSGVLHITLSVTLKESFSLNIPQSIHMAVDGVLRGIVMFNGSPVGEIIFPLPLYGIPCGTAEIIKLTGLCAFYVESDQNIQTWNKFSEEENPFATISILEKLEDILKEEPQHLPTAPEYTVKLEDAQNLWIMEV